MDDISHPTTPKNSEISLDCRGASSQDSPCLSSFVILEIFRIPPTA